MRWVDMVAEVGCACAGALGLLVMGGDLLCALEEARGANYFWLGW
jgi:hypothetical protein